MRYPSKIEKPLTWLRKVSAERPLAVIVAVGSISLLAYVVFALMPFFVPDTVDTHFPPYLALPEGGYALSNYYVLYGFICLNALVLFGLFMFALRTASQASERVGADPQAAAEHAYPRAEVHGEGEAESSDRRLVRPIVIFSIVFHLLMMATPFLLSTDMFDYIRHGRILAIYGENPLVIPATYFPEDPFFTAGGWVGTGSVYGSLHVYIVAMLARMAGDGFAANFLLFKGFFISLNLANLWLIWKITRRLKPGLEIKALMFYGWNPFILTLVVANAHNDILMLTLLLAGFLMYLDKRVVLGALFITLATLVKFITLPILLVYLALVIRQQRGLARRAATGAGIAVMSLAVLVISYLPLWAGHETFNYLTTVGQKTNFTLSSMIRDAAASQMQLSLSNTIVQLSLAACLGLYLLWHMWGVRDTESLLSASAGLAFLTPLVLFWFQPWYLTLSLGLIALRPHRLMLLASLTFSFSVVFFDSFWWHAPVSADIQKPLRVLVVFAPPVLLLLFLKGRESLPRLWRWMVAWSLEQSAGGKLKDAGLRRKPLAAPDAGIVDPSGLRLAVEVSVLVTAAMVPMAAVVTTSPQLRSLAELLVLKLQLLIS